MPWTARNRVKGTFWPRCFKDCRGLAVGAVVGVVLGILAQRGVSRSQAKSERNLRKELDDKRLILRRYEAIAVRAAPALDDEILVLRAHYLQPLVDASSFQTTLFTIVEAPTSRLK